MRKPLENLSLQELRRGLGLRQTDLGNHCTVIRVEKGRALPSPRTLTAWAAIAGLPPAQVMAACRESQRRALVARAGRSRSRRTGRAGGVVVRARASGSCPQPKTTGAA
jgi:transcriptional regulator with XRE-family HTH domain